MKAIVTLARFISPEEQKEIARELVALGYSVVSDPWSPQGRFLVGGDDFEAILNMNGVAQIVPLVVETRVEKLAAAADAITTFAKSKKLKSFTLQLKIFGPLPFTETAFRETIHKHVRLPLGAPLHVELNGEGDSAAMRIGLPLSLHSHDRPNIILVLESPKTTQEVVDFMRLASIFGTPLRVSIEGDLRTVNALQSALPTPTAGSALVTTYKTTRDATKGLKAAAFSLWGSKNETCLRSKKFDAFVFGSSERGLKLETIKACDAVIHLGPAAGEAMSGSQAAAYALGVLS